MSAVMSKPQQQTALAPLEALKRSLYPQVKALANNDEKVANSLFATAVRIASDPKIFACTQPSIINCLTRAIDLGLNLDPAFGEAYFIPYGTTLTFQLGAKGYAALAQTLGGWEIQVIPVFDCDSYSVKRKLVNGFMESEVELEFNDEQREKNAHNQDWCIQHLRCVMANARRLENGSWTVYSLEPAMSAGEINRRRLCSSNQKSATPTAIWKDHFIAMAEKTALGALAKKLPKTKGVEKLIKAFNDDDSINSTATVVEMPQVPLPAPTPAAQPQPEPVADTTPPPPPYPEQTADDSIEEGNFTDVPVTDTANVDKETGEIIPEQPVYAGKRWMTKTIEQCTTNNMLVAFWETVPDNIKPEFQQAFDERQDLLRFGDQ